MFKNGQTITLKDGQIITVNGILGQGGQGVVYDVSSNGKRYALKWYLAEYLKGINQKDFYDNLSENQQAGAPSKDFLWPLAVSDYKKNSFGYLMELRPKRFCDFTAILNAKKKIKNVKNQLKAAKNICRAFQSLHKAGYSYQDINDGNFFVDVDNGDVLICDNDNVAPCGTWMGMNGKDRYIAPEVVLRQKHAGMESDLYSLAVVLFMLFFIAHPLEGKTVHSCPCLTTKYIRKFYAEKPVFIYDPVDDSNRPVPGLDNNVIALWNCYPDQLKDFFVRSFTKGLHDASYRVRENEWIECFEHLEDALIECPHCKGEQFYNRNEEGLTFECEDCGKEIRKPFVWSYKKVGKNLSVGGELRSCHIGLEDNELIGRVVESKKHIGLWGLENTSSDVWMATFSNGKEMKVNPKEILPLFRDTKVKILDKEANIIF